MMDKNSREGGSFIIKFGILYITTTTKEKAIAIENERLALHGMT